MRIYFEDGLLVNLQDVSGGFIIKIDAAEGPRANQYSLNCAKKYHPDAVIYTNSLIALSNDYAWNEKLEVPEIYIRAGEDMKFYRIDRLTERELRFAHNICKMYLAGAFDTSREVS